jgi:hypothetical protein
MQRDALLRAAAFQRLHRMASAAQLTLDEQAQRLLAAVERLAPPPAA